MQKEEQFLKNPLIFYRERKQLFILTCCIVILCYWKLAFTQQIGIDTEQFVLRQYGKEWIIDGLGRFGYYYSVVTMNFGAFQPYYNGVLFLLYFLFSILLWPVVFNILHKSKSQIIDLAFVLVYVTYPLWIAQYYFTLQSAAISFGLLLQAISFYIVAYLLTCEVGKGRRFLLSTISILCSTYAIGTYQSFAALHVVNAAACILVSFDRITENNDDKTSHKKIWSEIFLYVFHFLASIGLYYAICKINGWGTSDYLSIIWGKQPIKQIIETLFTDIKTIWFGSRWYLGTGRLFSVSICIIVLFLVCFCCARRKIRLKIDYIVLIAGNLFSGILLNLVIGAVPPNRGKIPLFFSVAFLCMYAIKKSYNLVKKHLLSFRFFWTRIPLVIMILFSLSSVFSQSHMLYTYLYTIDVCDRQQFEFASELERKIESVGGNYDSTVVFIGTWDAPLNYACRKVDCVGSSSFNWSYKANQPTSGTRRSVLYLDAAFGKKYPTVLTEENIELAVRNAENMPSYPSEGYVTKIDDVIIIKLFEPR